MEDAGSQSTRYATLLTILEHRRVITVGGALFLLILLGWCGFRTGIAELYVLAGLSAVGAYFVLKAVIEIVDLVAETLMPR